MQKRALAQFSDPGKEAALAGCIAEGTFDRIPRESLCPPEAFTDPRWRTVYGIACALRTRNGSTPVCLESVNDFIAFQGVEQAFQAEVDSSRTLPWRRWNEQADSSLAYSQWGAAYALGELERLYRERKAAEIGEELKSKALSIADAHRDLGELLNATTNEFDFGKLDSVRADLQKPPSEPVTLLRFKEQAIGTQGNLFMIYAQAKAGKTAVLGAMIAAAMPGDDWCDTFSLTIAPNEHHHAIIHFDCEQSPWDHYQILNSARRRAKREEMPSWIRSYCLTTFSKAQRMAALRAELQRASAECGGIHTVLLDGAADFMPDVNSIADTDSFVSELHEMAIKYNTIIGVVLHENPGKANEVDKARGHLGSHLERKCEGVIRVEKQKEEETSVIYSHKSRHAHIPKSKGMWFKWDNEAGYHATCEPQGRESHHPDVLLAEIFSCKIARDQAGGLTYTQIQDRLITLEGYKTRKSTERRMTLFIKGGFVSKTEDHYFLSGKA